MREKTGGDKVKQRNPIDARQTIAEHQQSDEFRTNLERLRNERRKRDQGEMPK